MTACVRAHMCVCYLNGLQGRLRVQGGDGGRQRCRIDDVNGARHRQGHAAHEVVRRGDSDTHRHTHTYTHTPTHIHTHIYTQTQSHHTGTHKYATHKHKHTRIQTTCMHTQHTHTPPYTDDRTHIRT